MSDDELDRLVRPYPRTARPLEQRIADLEETVAWPQDEKLPKHLVWLEERVVRMSHAVTVLDSLTWGGITFIATAPIFGGGIAGILAVVGFFIAAFFQGRGHFKRAPDHIKFYSWPFAKK